MANIARSGGVMANIAWSGGVMSPAQYSDKEPPSKNFNKKTASKNACFNTDTS